MTARATDYAGSIDDYIDFVLGRNQPQGRSQAQAAKADRKAAAKAREDARALKKAAAEAEAASARPWRRNAQRSTASSPKLPAPRAERAQPAPRETRRGSEPAPKPAGSK